MKTKLKLPDELRKYGILALSIIIASIIVGLSVYTTGNAIVKAIGQATICLGESNQNFMAELRTFKFPEVEEYDPKYGNNANIYLFEYTDYQCPFCARHTLYTFPQIKQNYIDQGKLVYVYKDLTLTIIHPYANVAAKYANCVYKIYGLSTYTEFKKWLFSNQRNWTNDNYKEIFHQKLKELGVDVGQIESCVASKEVENDIQGDLAEAQQYRMSGTPSFLIAIKTDKVTKHEFNDLKMALEDLADYGLRYKIGKTEDNQYIIVIFSGALPYEFFEDILKIGTN